MQAVEQLARAPAAAGAARDALLRCCGRFGTRDGGGRAAAARDERRTSLVASPSPEHSGGPVRPGKLAPRFQILEYLRIPSLLGGRGASEIRGGRRRSNSAHRTAPPTAPKVAWVDGGYCDHKVGDLAPEDQQFSATKPISEVPTADRLWTGVGDIMVALRGQVVTKVWRRGYYAAVSYMDSNVGTDR